VINLIKKILLSENRVADVKKDLLKDFSDSLIPLSYKTGKKEPNWFEWIIDSDPSGSQKYLPWIIKVLRKYSGGKLHPFKMSDLLVEKVVNSVILFHKNVDRMSVEKIKSVIDVRKTKFSVKGGGSLTYLDEYPIKMLDDILKAPKDINSYDNHELLETIVNSVSNIPTKKSIKGEAIKLYEDSYWTVILPKTHRASCLYGANTRWCTSAKDDPNTFNVYQSDTSIVFYVIRNGVNEYHDMNKIAINITNKYLRFFDSIDTEYNLLEITNYVDMFFGRKYSNSFDGIIKFCRNYFNDLSSI
jgi:hypothetical protein